MKNTLLFLTLAASTAFAAEYQIDTAHSNAQFSVRHMMVANVKGDFNKLTGTVIYDPKNLAASSIDAVVDISTVNTRDEKRDGHLKSPDFFDAAKFPTMTFKSKSIARNGKTLTIKGDLTIRGISKEVVFTVDGPTDEIKDPYGMTRFGASATAKVNRKDWGLNWNAALETGGVVVGDEVTITLDIEAVKKKS